MRTDSDQKGWRQLRWSFLLASYPGHSQFFNVARRKTTPFFCVQHWKTGSGPFFCVQHWKTGYEVTWVLYVVWWMSRHVNCKVKVHFTANYEYVIASATCHCLRHCVGSQIGRWPYCSCALLQWCYRWEQATRYPWAPQKWIPLVHPQDVKGHQES